MARQRVDNVAVTQQTYALKPVVRSRAAQLMVGLVLCVLAAAAGTASMLWYVRHYHLPVLPGEVSDTQVQLERTKLALEQKAAACAAVQKTADTSAAGMVQLNAELQFLRQQAQR